MQELLGVAYRCDLNQRELILIPRTLRSRTLLCYTHKKWSKSQTLLFIVHLSGTLLLKDRQKVCIGLPKYQMKRLQNVQSTAARIFCRIDKYIWTHHSWFLLTASTLSNIVFQIWKKNFDSIYKAINQDPSNGIATRVICKLNDRWRPKPSSKKV